MPTNAIDILETEQVMHSLTRDQIIDIAINAFPQYASRITAFQDVQPIPENTLSDDPIIINETKKVTESMSINYQEHSTGRAYIFIINCGKLNSSSTQYPTYTDYSVDLHAVCTYSSDAFMINGFTHRCTNNLVDTITSRGSLGGTAISSYSTYNLTESGSSNPYAKYVATFSVSLLVGENAYYETTYDAVITVTVDDGNLTIEGR